MKELKNKKFQNVVWARVLSSETLFKRFSENSVLKTIMTIKCKRFVLKHLHNYIKVLVTDFEF